MFNVAGASKSLSMYVVQFVDYQLQRKGHCRYYCLDKTVSAHESPIFMAAKVLFIVENLKLRQST